MPPYDQERMARGILPMIQAWKKWRRTNRLWRSYRVTLLLFRTLYVINRERNRVVQARARGDADVQPNLEALLHVLRDFRQTAVELGGLLIKLGQFLGARADLLPQAALDELAALLDDVEPERFGDITALLEREWHAPVAEICTTIAAVPAGAASLGQVHRAQLHDGRVVAIKVQRPGIDAIVRTDLRTLRFVLRVVAWLVPAANRITDLPTLYREFRRTVFEELDYQHEARNAGQFAELFADDPTIVVPAIIPAYSTRRVLVLEWMDGIKIAHLDELDAAGVNRDQLAVQLMQAYLKQILEAGFFHADPHPGNLLVQPTSDGARLVFLDFGMMGVITPKMRAGLRDCFNGIVVNDATRVVRGLDTLGFLSPTVDREALEPLVSALVARFTGFISTPAGAGTARRGGNTDPREVLGDVGTTLYDQPFRLPAQFAFFGRMAGILLGLTVALSPKFNFIEVATPYAQQFMGGGAEGGIQGILNLLGIESWDALGQTLLRDGVATVQSLVTLPRRLDRVLERAERGELHLVIDSDDGLLRGKRRGGRRDSAVTQVLSRPVPIWLPLSVAGAWGIITLTRWGRHAGR